MDGLGTYSNSTGWSCIYTAIFGARGTATFFAMRHILPSGVIKKAGLHILRQFA
jgi:hypothetical protein